jgi:hypothetical protein
MFVHLKAWFRAIVADVVSEERKITAALLSNVHGDISLVSLHVKRDVAVLKTDLQNVKAELLAEIQKLRKY